MDNLLGLAQNKPNQVQPPREEEPFVQDTDVTEGVPGGTPPVIGGSTTPSPTELPLGMSDWQTPGPTGVVSSWESNAERQAGIQFQQNVLTGRQTMLKSAQEMQAQGQEYQTQLSLGEYMRGQSAEKAGWTGGYMLDQKRQGDYLRASIQAQMYGQQELQRYGMETQLEAARLAYDLGKEQLAMQLYNEAYQRSITEAQMFGYYVSPEIRDTLNQYNAANLTLEDNPEDERALQIKRQVERWFQEQDINPNDLRTFSTVTFEREQYNQAKLDAILASIGDDPSTFLLRDANGNYSFDQDGQYVKMNFETITKNDFMTFLNSDNASEFAFADQSIKSYFNYLGKYTINDYLSGLGEDEVPTSEGFAAWLASGNNNRILKYLDTLGLSSSEKATLIKNIGSELTASFTASGVTLDLTTNLSTSTSNGTTGGTTTSGGTTTPAWVAGESSAESVVNYYKNPFDNKSISWTNLSEGYAKFFDITDKTVGKDDVARYFYEDVDFYERYFKSNGKLSTTSIPTRSTLKKTYDFLNRMHEISGGSSPIETGLKFIADKLGIPSNVIEFGKFALTGVQITKNDSEYGFKITTASLSTQQMNRLKEMGFIEQGGKLVINQQNQIEGSGYKRKSFVWGDADGTKTDYPAGSGWNTNERGALKIIGNWLHWFDMDWLD